MSLETILQKHRNAQKSPFRNDLESKVNCQAVAFAHLVEYLIDREVRELCPRCQLEANVAAQKKAAMGL